MSSGTALRAMRVGLIALVATAALAATAGAKTPSTYAQGHAYRHGTVPERGHQQSRALASSTNLRYGGAVDGVGVTTGPPRVYLVFWGSQWGSQSTNAQGNVTLAGDPKGMAPDVQAFMKGLGTGSETWSGVMTQYCEGVATGAQTCPANASHVGYPTGGALAGVWVDESVAAPSSASGHQLGVEAVNAATHFGNTTQASNRNTQYVIISPTGTHPDGFNTIGSQFCAWHDYTGDSALPGGPVTSPDGELAFTNLPYITDAGQSCGQNFVNSTNGTLDGVTIVEGHEYAETITDQYPIGGWTDSQTNENGDKCAWISSGQGHSQDITLTTGTFAVQSTWANDYNSGAGGCEVSHPIVGNGGQNTVTVTNPGSQSSTVGSAVSLRMSASDSGGASLTYSASALPAGLSISSSGLISGTPTTAQTTSVTVTATDTTGASGTATFSWTVTAGGGCTPAQLLRNPGFETGAAAPWTASAGVISPSSAGEAAHSGNYDAWLDGTGTIHTSTLSQKVTIPSGCSAYQFSFWLHVDTADKTVVAHDKLRVQVVKAGTVVATLGTFSNLNAATGYARHTFDLSPYAGQTVTLKFVGSENSTLQTSFVIDDTALNIS